MRWLSLLISFILRKINSARPPSLKDMALAVLEEAAYRSRKPVILALGGLICIALLCGGFFMSLIDLTRQFDETGVVYITASNAAGLILVLLSVGTFFWIFTSAWPGAQETKAAKSEAATHGKASSLEHALSLLVMDFIKERELKREHAEQRRYTSPPAEKETPPIYQ